SHVEAFSNSFVVELECPKLGASVLQIRVQEQSGWIVTCIAQIGWLRSASDEQWNSFCNAVEGFYRKSGIELVREQIENAFTKRYPYDVDSAGLLVWPSKSFDIEIVTDLKAEGDLRPMPDCNRPLVSESSSNRQALLGQTGKPYGASEMESRKHASKATASRSSLRIVPIASHQLHPLQTPETADLASRWALAPV
nr:hypothetical protein [Pirellula sp.]